MFTLRTKIRCVMLSVITVCFSAFNSAIAQQDTTASQQAVVPSTLQQAISLYLEGEYETAVITLNQLLDTGGLSKDDRSEARKYLAFTYISIGGKENEEKATNAFKDIVREDERFDMNSLRISQETEPPATVIRLFGQAVVEIRQEERERQRELFSKQSRSAAFLRSVVLPGWGQRYRGYNNRGYMMVGLTVAAIANAVVTEGEYWKARDKYEDAPEGAKFEDLYDNWQTKGDRADLAFGIVGAVWLLNVVDAVIQGPNITEGRYVLRTPVPYDGVQVVYNVRF